jgi:hypothetical protein
MTWTIRFPSNTLLTEEEQSIITQAVANGDIEKCNTREEIKEALLYSTRIQHRDRTYDVLYSPNP